MSAHCSFNSLDVNHRAYLFSFLSPQEALQLSQICKKNNNAVNVLVTTALGDLTQKNAIKDKFLFVLLGVLPKNQFRFAVELLFTGTNIDMIEARKEIRIELLKQKKFRILKLFITANSSEPTAPFLTDLQKAVLNQDAFKLITLLQKGTSPNETNKNGDTPFDMAITNSLGFDMTNIIKILVHYGADINHSAYDGTPLGRAVQMNNGDLVSSLIALGSDVNVADKHNYKAMQYTRGNVQMIQLLLGALQKRPENSTFNALQYLVLKTTQ